MTPTNMLTFLVDLYSFLACCIYGGYRQHILSDYQYFNQQQNDKHFYTSVITNGYLLQMISLCWCRGNIQHSMLANPDYNNISLEIYNWETFLKFMLVLCVFITSSLTQVYVEVIFNNQC